MNRIRIETVMPVTYFGLFLTEGKKPAALGGPAVALTPEQLDTSLKRSKGAALLNVLTSSRRRVLRMDLAEMRAALQGAC